MIKKLSIARLPILFQCPPNINKINAGAGGVGTIHPQVDLIMEHLIGTCLKHSLIPSQQPSVAEMFRKKLEKYNHIGLINNCYYPSNIKDVNDRDELQLMHSQFITNYFFYLFSSDDRIDSSSGGGDESMEEDMKKRNHLIDELVAVLNVYKNLGQREMGNKQSLLFESKDPHVNLLVQIMEELHSITKNQETIDRFVKSMEDFYNIGVRNCPTRNETPSEYIERRIHDSATYAMLNVVEITSTRNGVGLIGNEYDNEIFSRVHRLCAIVCSLVNDLLSYHKDVVLPSGGGNLLGAQQGGGANLSYIQVLLKNDTELSLEQATTQCIDYISESKTQFEDIMKECSTTRNCSSKQLEYLRGVEKFMNGICIWMLYSNRYRHKDQVYDELTQLINNEE